MSEPVEPRPYHSSVREEQARRTRQAILTAARQLFAEQGYAATTIAQIAAAAGVAVDTVYASVGTKPVLMRLLMEIAISGTDQAVPAEQRDYVQQIRAATTAQDKIRIYAAAVTEVNARLAPLHLVLRGAAASTPELAQSHPGWVLNSALLGATRSGSNQSSSLAPFLAAWSDTGRRPPGNRSGSGFHVPVSLQRRWCSSS